MGTPSLSLAHRNMPTTSPLTCTCLPLQFPAAVHKLGIAHFASKKHFETRRNCHLNHHSPRGCTSAQLLLGSADTRGDSAKRRASNFMDRKYATTLPRTRSPSLLNRFHHVQALEISRRATRSSFKVSLNSSRLINPLPSASISSKTAPKQL